MKTMKERKEKNISQLQAVYASRNQKLLVVVNSLKNATISKEI